MMDKQITELEKHLDIQNQQLKVTTIDLLLDDGQNDTQVKSSIDVRSMSDNVQSQINNESMIEIDENSKKTEKG